MRSPDPELMRYPTLHASYAATEDVLTAYDRYGSNYPYSIHITSEGM